jgi:3-dehydroquinate synthase
VLLALGGGVVGDLAGFVAATYMRGIDWVQVPTSLLAQVDSSVGGKVAVNLPQGKNLMGAFYPPDAVLLDPTTLSTLARREHLAGQAEVVKYGLLRDREFFRRCVAEFPNPLDYTPFLIRSLEHKAAVVAQDEREAGLRMGLNLGHTMGHAIEAAGEYRRWGHGASVALGLRYVYRLARRLGTVSPEELAEVEDFLVLSRISPPVPKLAATGLLRRLKRDKKSTQDRVRWVLPTGIGSWRMEEGIPQEVLADVWRELQAMES